MDETKIEACARAAHETNRTYCLAIGDTSQTHWEDAPEWQKASARSGVLQVLAGSTPEKLHESWLAEKIASGWVYGPVKDAEAKTHPCMVAYADLAQAQCVKDGLFLFAVRCMAASLGLKVTYPASPAREAMGDLPAMPAYPERTVDYAVTPWAPST